MVCCHYNKTVIQLPFNNYLLQDNINSQPKYPNTDSNPTTASFNVGLRYYNVAAHLQLSQHLQQLSQHIFKFVLDSYMPVNPHHLYQELFNHMDQVFAMNLMHNLQSSCVIGYPGPHFSHCCSNLSSAFQQPLVLDNTLPSECST